MEKRTKAVIDYIHISNFKSLKEITLKDCRRINLFIGRPNVGKSNLLEALSLFCMPDLRFAKKKSIQQFIRVENDAELFFDGQVDSLITVETNEAKVEVQLDNMGISYLLSNKNSPESYPLTFSNLTLTSTKKKDLSVPLVTPLRSYFYPSSFEKEKFPLTYLMPPGGSNLMSVVSQLPGLKEELRIIFNDYGLKYVFDTSSQEIKVMKEKKPGEIFLIPFHSIADTLQRMIFYKAAIESNGNSILVFEEPEAHSYPPFISKVTHDIIKSESNQFFITTHSPYVVNDFLELSGDEVAIYFVDFKNGETVVKRATKEEMQEMYEYGVDLFFNTEIFLK